MSGSHNGVEQNVVCFVVLMAQPQINEHLQGASTDGRSATNRLALRVTVIAARRGNETPVVPVDWLLAEAAGE